MLAVASPAPPADQPSAPIAPITPILDFRAVTGRSGSPLPMLLDAARPILTTSGRAALALAFEQLTIGPGDEVLLPAYHCTAMTGPIRALGATPVSYRLRRDLTIDAAEVAARVGPRTRCVLADRKSVG